MRTLTAASGGVFTRSDLARCGHTDDDVRRWVAEDVAHRLHRGVFGVGIPAQFPDGRLLELTRGLARWHRDSLAASRHSALVLHGLPTYDVPLDVAHFIRLSGAAQSGPGVKV
jgi:hypothetical protein